MVDYKAVLGVLGVIIGSLGYIPYYRDIFAGKTKPHAFSWLGWLILEIIILVAQIKEGAGTGMWVTAASIIIMTGIVYLAFRRGQQDIKLSDWVAFISGVVAILLWLITNDPTASVILVTLADAFMFIPTYRKAFNKPHEETLLEYLASSIKWILGILALQNYSLATWLYPASLVLTNGLFVIFLLVRRRQLQKI